MVVGLLNRVARAEEAGIVEDVLLSGLVLEANKWLLG